MADTTQQVQPAQDKAVQIARERRAIGDVLQGDKFKRAIEASLPKHCTPDRFIRVALTATMRVPDLLKCTPESFYKCCFELSALGLEPDGRRAHLIPRKNRKMCACGHWKDQHRGQNCTHCGCTALQDLVECTLVVDYKGILELVRRSGEVSYIHADVVRKNDEFDFQYGTDAFLKHTPAMADAGAVVAAYSFVKLKDGTQDFMVISPQEIEKIRQVSPAKDDGPWKTWPDEMAKKSVFRRHSKWLPFSSELQEKIASDDDYVGGADITTGGGGERATLDLASFRPSEDEHRGHDDSMTSGSTEEDVKASEKPETREETTRQEQPRQTAASTHRGPIKEYPKGEMPDAMEMRCGFECYYEGKHFRVVENGDLQEWAQIGAAPPAQPTQPEPEPEKEKLTSAPRGKAKNPADAFDFKAAEPKR